MSLFSAPPTKTKATFRRGDTHLGVYSLQTLLNHTDVHLATDGVFGPGTEEAVKLFQSSQRLATDGVVGAGTQAALLRLALKLAAVPLPKGLLEGLCQFESGRLIAAVNASVPGGIDYGYTQRRVYTPYDPEKVAAAARPAGQVTLAARELDQRAAAFRVGRNRRCPFNEWELAVLAHNWPWAASRYHRDGRLPEPDKRATWVSFAVLTYDAWAHYYVEHVTAGVVW